MQVIVLLAVKLLFLIVVVVVVVVVKVVCWTTVIPDGAYLAGDEMSREWLVGSGGGGVGGRPLSFSNTTHTHITVD